MKDLHPDLIELLVQRATEGLDDTEASRLAALLAKHQLEDTLELDLAAAAASNAFSLSNAVGEIEDAPLELQAKLQADAAKYFDRSNVVELGQPSTTRPTLSYGWAAAAMLALAFMLNVWIDREPASMSDAERRDQLLASDVETQQLPWAVSEFQEFAEVVGDVVWSDERQEGYLLLSNMPANNPAESQYQLWIVDPDRDSNPVDGGVFDVAENGASVVVPIAATLSVDEPVAFAITREQPGGAVVSKGPLLVVASAG